MHQSMGKSAESWVEDPEAGPKPYLSIYLSIYLYRESIYIYIYIYIYILDMEYIDIDI